MFWHILIMSLVGAAIGWFTNYLAIKLIFRPINPVRIPLTNFEFQGLVPKRRDEIAISIGNTVEEQLLSIDELLESLNTGANQIALVKNIRIGILKVIRNKMPSFFPQGIKNTILKYAGNIIDREAKSFIENNMERLIEEAVLSVDVAKLVERKINDFDLLELESIIIDLSGRELRYIEVLGGILGFLIGLIQGVIISLLPIV
ncbi:MAG: DUF445 family protein [Clostridiales bacterium]|nr:DUF445 family protein [Clostridiales bacterium]